MDDLRQYAPFPTELQDLVDRVRYQPGWRAWLTDKQRDPEDTHGQSAGGLTLIIYADVNDTYHPQAHRPVNHYFIVPAATFNRSAWLRWLLGCYLQVEQHEACEWFRLVDDGCCGHPEAHHETRAGQYKCWECDTDAFHEYRPPSETRPFAPTHGPGDDPYTIKELATDEQRRTSFRGVVKV